MNTLYTIGHSNYPPEKFLGLLQLWNINWILDVRSAPYSQWATQFNREALESLLNQRKIHYFHMGKVFGARQTDTSLYPNGYLDFSLASNTEDFKKGLSNVKKGLSKGYTIALMCAEKNPIECHRTIWLSREFKKKGLDIKHILDDGSVITQEDIEEQLLEKYFPNRDQLGLFDDSENTRESEIDECYRRQNSLIGYKLKDLTDDKHL